MAPWLRPSDRGRDFRAIAATPFFDPTTRGQANYFVEKAKGDFVGIYLARGFLGFFVVL